MKHFRLTFLLTILMSVVGVNVSAHDIEVANADGVTIYYSYINKNTELQVSYRGSGYQEYSDEYSGSVAIPESVTYDGKTYSVTRIGYSAFRDCSGLTSVTIPQSVTKIIYDAFNGCSGLISVTISNSVTSIGESAFWGCSGLTSINIPNSVTFIGHSAFFGCTSLNSVSISNSITVIDNNVFQNCSSLTSVSIPNSVTSIGDYAFKGCTSLTSIAIPNSVTTIGSMAFQSCSGLLSISIPNSVESIGVGAFQGCSGLIRFSFPEKITEISSNVLWDCRNLTALYIPNSVTSIGGSAFYYCEKLQSITIPKNVTSIGNYAFGMCRSLTSITLPDNITKIEDNTFTFCSLLKSVTIPDKVESIGKSAFSDCEKLESVIIPNSVKSIGENAFYSCGALSTINIPNQITSIEDKTFMGCYKLAEIVLPDNLESIGYYAFCTCPITSINIPKGVTFIDSKAFNNCTNLHHVTSEIEEPFAIADDVFEGISSQAVLMVPSGTKISYQAFSGWTSHFAEVKEKDNPGESSANILTIKNMTCYKGKQLVLPIGLTNQKEITGFQLDLYLPAGVTVATNSKGKMIIETTERMDGNYSVSGNQRDGFVRIVGYSADGDAFTGNSGDFLNVTLNIDENMADGDYTIRLKDIVLSDVNNTEYHPADVGATLTVKSYVLGDVDNSGAININDVVCIINYILGKTVNNFIAEAADVDGSGAININDVVTIINRYILMKTSAPAMFAENATRRAVNVDENYLQLDDITIEPGETNEIQMQMTNTGVVAAIQGKLTLPAGLSIVKTSRGKVDAKNIDDRSEDFTLSCNVLDDGSLTFAQYSADGFTYEGNTGGIFTFKIKADETATAGTYSVTLSNVVLSIDGVGYDIPDRTSSLTVTGTSGISNVNVNDNDNRYYTLDGQLLQGKPTQKGVYIVNGRKVVLK